MQIFIFHNGQQMGPIPATEVAKRLKAGEFFPTDLAWHEGIPRWVPLSEINELQIAPFSSLPPVIETSGSKQPRVWTVFASYVVTVTVYLLATILMVVAAIFITGGNPHGVRTGDAQSTIQELVSKPKIFLPIVFGGQCIVFASALICAALSKTPFRERLSIRTPRISLPLLGLLMLGSVALSQGFGVAMSLMKIEVEGTIKLLTEVLNQSNLSNLSVMILIVGVTPGVCEELFFRGYVQTRFTQRWGPKISILATSAMFAVFHMDLMQGVFVILIGLYFGLAMEKTGSLWIPILCHTSTNVSATLISWAFQDVESNLTIEVSVLIVSLALIALSTWKLWKLPYYVADGSSRSVDMAATHAPLS